MAGEPVTAPVSNHARAVIRHEAWRRRLSNALGAPVSLDRLSDGALSKARRHFDVQALHARPDAWLYATLLGAEQERRAAYRIRTTPPPPATATTTAAEHAWREAQNRTRAA